MNKKDYGLYKSTLKKCAICGMLKAINKLIRCKICNEHVCLFCFNIVKNVCANCTTEEYNEKYAEKIKTYAE